MSPEECFNRCATTESMPNDGILNLMISRCKYVFCSSDMIVSKSTSTVGMFMVVSSSVVDPIFIPLEKV